MGKHPSLRNVGTMLRGQMFQPQGPQGKLGDAHPCYVWEATSAREVEQLISMSRGRQYRMEKLSYTHESF
jgi:hypothetical protein